MTKRPHPAHTLVECPIQHICQVSRAGAPWLVILRAQDTIGCYLCTGNCLHVEATACSIHCGEPDTALVLTESVSKPLWSLSSWAPRCAGLRSGAGASLSDISAKFSAIPEASRTVTAWDLSLHTAKLYMRPRI